MFLLLYIFTVYVLMHGVGSIQCEESLVVGSGVPWLLLERCWFVAAHWFVHFICATLSLAARPFYSVVDDKLQEQTRQVLGFSIVGLPIVLSDLAIRFDFVRLAQSIFELISYII
jgi:hypothetical protein